MDRPYEEQPAAKRQRQEAGAVEPDAALAAGALLEVVPPEHQDDVPTPDADAQAMEAAMKEQKEVEKVSSRPLMHPICKNMNTLRLAPAYYL